MKNPVEIFSELGLRLQNFGIDTSSQQAIEQACVCNSWFTPADICQSVRGISEQMLVKSRIESWLASYSTASSPRQILVVMAGNIPLVGFFDLLCVVASGHRCLVKPSGKDTTLIKYIIEQLLTIEPAIPIEMYNGISAANAVIATGSNNTNRYFRTIYSGIPTLLRGSRQSVAVLSGDETKSQLAGLSNDIFAYSGLGCRNISRLFLPRGYTLKLTAPRMNPKYHNNYLQTKALLTMEQKLFMDLGEAVATEDNAFPRALSQITYSHYNCLSEVSEWLTAHDSELQCVVSATIGHSRQVAFGQAQRPTLTDYPDAVDVMKFLSGIS